MQDKGTILILGHGGFGVQLGEMLIGCGRYRAAAFLDDRADNALGCLADCEDPALRRAYLEALVALGDNRLRLAWLERLQKAGYAVPSFVHPQAYVSPTAVLGAGTLVLPFACVGAGAVLGAGCLVNVGAIVDHNAVLADGVHVAPGGIVKAGASAVLCQKIESGTVLRAGS
jgi:UDP-N-acetylbacillosamine N-acetyltransferase